ncbi:MAG TPA: type II CAAX endopeptidase family protein [Bryobacteraceae bacterium]|jgi:hypothetical protein|nr:type II CAAX endopeptidase family protein [Bryobacteraceae bacterium]
MEPDPIDELPIAPPPVVEFAPPEPLPEAPAAVPGPAKPPRQPFWGYLDLLLFIGLAVGLTVILLVPVVVYAKVGNPQSAQTIALDLGAQAVLYAAIYFAFKIVFATRYHQPVFRSLGWRRGIVRPGVYALLGVLLAIGVQGLLQLLRTPEVKSPVENLIDSRLTLFLVGVLAVVAAPIFEEAVFRGFLQPLFSRTFGTIAGILITAALFGGLHWTEYSGVWQYAAAITILGIVFGWIRARTNSLIPSTIMHACHNGVAVVGLIISKYSHLK